LARAAALALALALLAVGCVSSQRPTVTTPDDVPVDTVSDSAQNADAGETEDGNTDDGAGTTDAEDADTEPACSIGEDCDDGDPCTVGDVCRADGTCAGTTMVCEDNNPCTVGACALVEGEAKCLFVPQAGGTCTDGQACTINDACQPDGTCAGDPKTCDDGDPCTLDTCNESDGSCSHTFAINAACDDGNACTVEDACTLDPQDQNTPVCRGIAKSCDDGLSCSTDTCDDATGQCQHDISSCVCLTDAQCDDGDPCTVDACGADGTCSSTPWSGPTDQAPTCDDDDPCTEGDVCQGDGNCAGTPKDCDDDLACTVDTCDATSGACVHDDAACECTTDAECEDDDPCAQGVCGDDRMCAIQAAQPEGTACTMGGSDGTTPAISGACTDARCGGVVQVAAGFHHTCALTAAGVVRCWGLNDHGQLGTGNDEDLLYKSDQVASELGGAVFDGARAVAVALGDRFSCAVMDTGVVRCWGANDRAQLGLLGGASQMDNDGEAPTTIAFWAHTYSPGPGELPYSNPAVVTDLAQTTGPDAIASGEAFTCVLGQSGHIHCWGASDYEQGLGGWLLSSDFMKNKTTIMDEADEKPSDVWVEYGGTAPKPGDPVQVKIVAGREHACVLDDAGWVHCWGRNQWGQLGQGSTKNSSDIFLPSPLLVSFAPDRAVDVAAGGDHTCVALASGLVRCWGRNHRGQLGAGHTNALMDDATENPSVVSFLPRHAVRVACGGAHTCALLDDGTVHCWGQNDFGQLGAEHTNDLMDEPGESPSDVNLSEPAVALTAGQTHTCALLASQQVVCWGRGLNGRLGTGSTLRVGDAPGTMPPAGYSNAMGAPGSLCSQGALQCLSGTCTATKCE